LLPTVPPDATWVKPHYHPDYDPLWAALQDMEIPVNLHGGTGSPNYPKAAAVPMVMISELPFYGNRPLAHMILGGVFERFPKLKFVLTENGAAMYPPIIKDLDRIISMVSKGAIGELKYTKDQGLPRLASEYFKQSCWLGASFPGPVDWAARSILGPDRFMWGSDYPHDEGTAPFTRENLRAVFCDTPEAELREVLAGNAAKLYDFDLEALQPLANQYGPTVEEIATPLTKMPENPNMALRKAAAGVAA